MAKMWIVLFILLLPVAAVAADNPQPNTGLDVHSIGPERVGIQSAVSAPPDNPQTQAKIHLGKELYFDTRLSKDNTISCATCHNPAMGWSDAGPTSTGINGQKGGRRSPPVSNSAYNPLQFWDGRAPSLEEQAKGPIQNPVEMGNTHEVMIKSVSDIPGYVEEFKAVFGTTPITIDQVAQAIGSYERTIVTTDSPFDRFVSGDEASLTPIERKGLEIFNGKGHCTACHWGSNFSDGRFHNLGVKPGAKPDLGRYEITKNEADKGCFKTPTVRDAGLRAPFMHDGSEKSLESLIKLYDNGGGPDKSNLDRMIVPLGLSEKEIEALVAFISRGMTSINYPVANEKPIPQSEMPK
jgi:cytochrome c peroxidase